MRFDNPPTDRQPHPGALRFGGEKCIEDLVYFFPLEVRRLKSLTESSI